MKELNIEKKIDWSWLDNPRMWMIIDVIGITRNLSTDSYIAASIWFLLFMWELYNIFYIRNESLLLYKK